MQNNKFPNVLIEDHVLSTMDKSQLLAAYRGLSTEYLKSTTLLGQHQLDAVYQQKLLKTQTAQWEEMYELLRLRQYEVEVFKTVIESNLLFHRGGFKGMKSLNEKIMKKFYSSKDAGLDVDMEGLPEDWNV